MKDAITSHRLDKHLDPVHFAETMIQLEQVEVMKKRLERLVELGLKNNMVIRAASQAEQNNFLIVYGLLKTVTDLQERYSHEIATIQTEIDRMRSTRIS